MVRVCLKEAASALLIQAIHAQVLVTNQRIKRKIGRQTIFRHNYSTMPLFHYLFLWRAAANLTWKPIFQTNQKVSIAVQKKDLKDLTRCQPQLWLLCATTVQILPAKWLAKRGGRDMGKIKSFPGCNTRLKYRSNFRVSHHSTNS